MVARKITAPNSKVLAFHVDRVCERYNFHSTDLIDGLVVGNAWGSSMFPRVSRLLLGSSSTLENVRSVEIMAHRCRDDILISRRKRRILSLQVLGLS